MATSARREASDAGHPAQGLKRVALLAVLAFVALLMLRDSLAYVLRPIDPALALRIDPANAEVAASRAEQMLREDAGSAPQAEALARRALQRSPVSAAGARMLATTRDLAGDTAAARRLMAYSESLSRRDLPTQAWLIEDAVRHDDIPRALHHYDIALRSSEASKPLLFPVLVGAIAQPPVVDALIDTIAARPSWGRLFLDRASIEAKDFDGLARLMTGLARRGYLLPPEAVAEASGRMVDAGHYASGWAVYAAAHPGARADALRGPGLASATDAQGPFGWTPLNVNGLFTELRRYGASDALAYSAGTGTGGIAAHQLVLLPAGDFKLTGRAFERDPAAPAAQVRLTCAGSGLRIAAIPAGAAAFSGTFTVPDGCPAQWAELFVEGGDNPLGATGMIGELRLASTGKGERK